MDLESLDSKIVPYYNMTNKSILEYSNKIYYKNENEIYRKTDT